MAFNVPKFSSLSKLGNVLSSSVGETLGINTTHALPIAIEFGTAALKILQVQQGEPPSLVAAACLETPLDLLRDQSRRLKFQLEGLPRLLRSGGFKGKRAVCAIPAWAIHCKHLSLQRVEGQSTAALVNAALPGAFNLDPATIVHRFTEVPAPDRPGKAEVIVTAVSFELVQQLMGAIAACKLQPVGMHSEFAAVLRTFDHVHKRETDSAINTLYLDIGNATTNVMISHGKDLAFARAIQLGGRHFDETIAKQLKCDLAEAGRRRMEADELVRTIHRPATVAAPAPALVGAGAHAEPFKRSDERGLQPLATGFTTDLAAQPRAAFAPAAADLSEPLESLTDEVLMCVRYHESQFPGKRVERAIFVGGEARHKGLCQAIAKALRLPAQMADPLARVARTGSEPALGVDLKQPQPGWAVTLGLCLSPTDL
ncbi:MAG TPA: pilus assembly protein PilM [Phycisphaerales bacterium]|nr:pilus assembly protein PilM [Phycisphaerales bacterium]